MDHEFDYIVIADDCRALPVRTNLNLLDFQAKVRQESQKDGSNDVWYWGTVPFANPKVIMAGDFHNLAAIFAG